MPYLAIYETKRKERVEVPLVEYNGRTFLETQKGTLVAFTARIEDAHLGELNFVEAVELKPQPPVPSDPIRDTALAELRSRLDALPAADLESFLRRERGLKRAIDARNDFATATIAQIREFNEALNQEAKRIEAAREAMIPPPRFEPYELRRSFRGRDFGDLRVEDIYDEGSLENGWNSRWYSRCSKCEASGPPRRTVTAQVLLEMESGYRAEFSCEGPCRR